MSSPAWAEAAAAAATAAPPPGVPASAIWQTAFGLLAVIGVLFLAAFLLRRANGGRGFGASGPLRMVGGLMVGTRERIVVVEIEDTWIVVGLAPGQMRTLHTLPRGELPAASASDGDFASRLAQMIGRKS